MTNVSLGRGFKVKVRSSIRTRTQVISDCKLPRKGLHCDDHFKRCPKQRCKYIRQKTIARWRQR